jgi:PAS domain S-box-containing protein
VSTIPGQRGEGAGGRPYREVADEGLARAVLDSLASPTAVLAANGDVRAVNAAWERWVLTGVAGWQAAPVGTDYLVACARAARGGDRAAADASAAIRSVLDGEDDLAEVEHADPPPGDRVHRLTVTPLASGDGVVLNHVDITSEATARGRVREQARHRSALAELAQGVLSLEDADSVRTAAVEILVRTLGTDFADLWRLGPDQRTGTLEAGVGWSTEAVGSFVREVRSGGIAEHLLRTGTTVVAEDLPCDERFEVDPFLARSVTSAVVALVPGEGGEHHGVLATSTRVARAFTAEEVHLVESVAGIAGAALDRLRAMGALEASEERFRLIADSAEDTVFVLRVDPDPRLEYISPAVERLLGYPQGAFYDDPAFTLAIVHPDDRTILADGLDRTDPQRFQVRMRAADGPWRWLDLHVVPRFRPDGMLVAQQGIARDVTALKELQSSLGRRYRQQQVVADLAADALHEQDLHVTAHEAVFAILDTLGAEHVALWQIGDPGAPPRPLAATEPAHAEDGGEGEGATAMDAETGPNPAAVSATLGALLERAPSILAGHELATVGIPGLPATTRCLAAVAVPGGERAAVLVAAGAEEGGISLADLPFLTGVGGLLSAAFERQRTAAQLRASEERFRLLAETAQDVVYIRRVRPSPCFEYVSPAAERLTGYPQERWYAEPDLVLRCTHPDDRAEIRRRSEATEPQRYEVRFRHADGTYRSVEFRTVPIVGDDGELVEVRGLATDVTHRRRLQDRLAERGEHGAAVAGLGLVAVRAELPAFLDAVVRTVARTLACEYAVVVAPSREGDDLEVVAGSGFPDGLLDDLADADVAPPQEHVPAPTVLSRGAPLIFDDLLEESGFGTAPIRRELGVRSGVSVQLPTREGPGGSLSAFSSTPHHFSRGDVDLLQSIAALAAAAMDREVMEAQLELSEERYRLLADSASDVIWRYRVHPDRQLEYVSPSVERLAGYRPEELYADHQLWDALGHPDDRWLYEPYEGSTALSGEPYTLRWRHRDGRVVWTEEHLTAVRDADGRLVAVQGIARDVTARREIEDQLERAAQDLVASNDALEHSNAALARTNEELRRAARLRDEFLAMTSHELRTPLTPLLGFLDLLSRHWDDLPDERRRSFLRTMDGQARRLAHLVDNLLVMAEASAGTLLGRPTPTPVAPVVHAVLENQPRGSEVVIRGEPGAVAMVDGEHLRRVLDNLVSNAFRYGQPPVTVEVSTHEASSEAGGGPDRDGRAGRVVRVRVLDTGDGVPQEITGILFERFVQKDSGDRRTAYGAGLGLAVCRELARMNGGEVTYEHGPAGGACFVLTLPASTSRTDGAE